MRVNISLPEDLIELIDEYCQKYGFNRSELIRKALRLELGSQPATPSESDLAWHKDKLDRYDRNFPLTTGETQNPTADAVIVQSVPPTSPAPQDSGFWAKSFDKVKAGEVQEVIEEIKTAPHCAHGIMKGGNCGKCPKGIAK